jgi:hypothetical protein
MSASLDIVCLTPAWQHAGLLLRTTATRFLTLPVGVESASPSLPAGGLACAVLLSNMQHQVELRIAIGADLAGANAWAAHLFGEGGSDLATDMLIELTNMFMGALRSAFGKAAVPFAASIPAPIAPAQLALPEAPGLRQGVFTLMIADAPLVVHLGVRGKSSVRLLPAALREGAVLAKNVYNARGGVLVKRGVRLSATMIKNIQAIVPARETIEVMAS